MQSTNEKIPIKPQAPPRSLPPPPPPPTPGTATRAEQQHDTSLRPRRHRHSDHLIFAPAAWLKLMFFLHAGRTEVGGFGISAVDDPLYVSEFLTVRQRATSVSVAFDDAAIADHFDACVDRGLKPERFARIWIHTHPGDSAEPSVVDEQTFQRVFGSCDWALMCIVSRGGRSYARLSFAAGPGAALHLPLAVDWASWPAAVLDAEERCEQELAEWAAEYERNVHEAVIPSVGDAIGGWPGELLARHQAYVGGAADDEERYDAILEERLDGWRFDPWSDDVLQAAAGEWPEYWPEGTVWR